MSTPSRPSPAEICEQVGDAYFQRGLGYFRQGRVLQCQDGVDLHGVLMLHGQVQGSGGKVYEQYIAVSDRGQGGRITGTCSCPIGFNCKHVVAVYLTWLNRTNTETSSTRAAESWLARVAAAGAQPGTPAADRLLYVLRPLPKAVTVDLRLVRPLRSGTGLSKGRVIPLANLDPDYRRGDYLQPTDEEIIDLLRTLAGRSWPMVPRLIGSIGHLVLTRMLETGRCYWEQHHDGALRPAAARQLLIRWREHADATIALELATEPAAALILTDPPMFVDAGRQALGPLSTSGLKAAQLSELLHAPRLRRAQAEAVSRLLLREFPGLPLPTPTDVPLTEITNCKPVPCLTLTSEPAASPPPGTRGGTPAAPPRVHLLILEFDYAGQRLLAEPGAARAVIEGNDRLLRIHRDQASEQAACDRLLAAGCIPAAAAATTPLAATPHPGTSASVNPPPGHLARLVPGGADLIEQASRWSDLLRNLLPELAAAGWHIEMTPAFRLRFDQADLAATIDEEADAGGNDWFGLRFDLELDGQRLPLLPIIAPLLERGLDRTLPPVVSVPVPVADTAEGGPYRFVDLPAERLQPFLETLRELFDHLPRGRDGQLRLSRFDAPALDDLAARGIALQGGERLRDLAQRLRTLEQLPAVTPPAGLSVALRPYQQRGLDWLQFLRDFDLAGVLADDMGLGKTVQTLAHLLTEHEAGRLTEPALVIAPTSLVGNWRREAERFAPALRVLVLHGSDRHQHFARIPDHDLVLTTYPLLPRDQDHLRAARFSFLILDEAQTIKNPLAQAARIVRELQARHRLCLTGTPMENHLGELWALFDFLLPGFLGDATRFKRHWRNPIEQLGDRERSARLARRVAPFLLRRRKQDVLTELPPKTEIIRSTALGERQGALYEGIRLSMEQRVRATIAAQGLARSSISILDALLKLRQVCCDPRLLDLPRARQVQESAKLELLLDLLPEQLEEGRRILLFSQFTSMLRLIEPELDARGIAYSKLTGRTRKREEAIERFRGGSVDLFLISLKAGGLGLNLTEADTVILYDPWWNPAVEAQAADRAYRIGQDKPVFVYKLLTEQTVEERILALQEKKRALAEGIYREGSGDGAPAFTAEDIEELFAPIAG
ncbi:MAG: DEAD/DEAH box helicase [Chromatiaceae bacterium]|nr:MAG: DEAD/DEAH box helicase [Chromatiaceae bacterium]